jgi:hypothetical protein
MKPDESKLIMSDGDAFTVHGKRNTQDNTFLIQPGNGEAFLFKEQDSKINEGDLIMVEKTFSAATQYSAPIFLTRGRQLAISISGTFSATIQIQRCMKAEGDSSYPAHDDTNWKTVTSKTASFEDQATLGDNCWYRAYCSVYASGSPVVRMRT